jgi:hypothetical protein
MSKPTFVKTRWRNGAAAVNTKALVNSMPPYPLNPESTWSHSFCELYQLNGGRSRKL